MVSKEKQASGSAASECTLEEEMRKACTRVVGEAELGKEVESREGSGGEKEPDVERVRELE
jgi:hypothetical protein